MRKSPGGAAVLSALLMWNALVLDVVPQSEYAWNRVLHGWTNYSTAFTATDDEVDEYAAVGSVYVPPVNAAVDELGVVIIWFGSANQTFSPENFRYRVSLWSGIDQFAASPRWGDLGASVFAAPTGGSTSTPIATTRGGRPAFHIRFVLPRDWPELEQCGTYVIGISAIALSSNAGELFVPTAPFAGDSDVQAGNIVPFGWTFLLNSGGSTIYYGQLATALKVRATGVRPRLNADKAGSISISPPGAAACFQMESAGSLSGPWSPWDQTMDVNSDLMRFFRLVQPNPSRFAP